MRLSRLIIGAAVRRPREMRHPPIAEIDAHARPDQQRDAGAVTHVRELIYELLDAHADTQHLAEQLPNDPTWGAHLDYLRALQRRGRQILAQSTAGAPQ